MLDAITLLQRILGKLGLRRLFAFTPERWGKDRIEHDDLRATQRALGLVFGPRLFSRVYPGVPGRVHIHDTMLLNDGPEQIGHYIKVGDSAMANIEAALRVAGLPFGKITACLDFPSGFGRVTRRLCERIEPGRVTASEIDREALRFCAAEFGVKTIESKEDFRKIPFAEKFDLIWVGSLMTHLSPERALQLLDALTRQLRVGGALLFTTQGADCIEFLPLYGWMFVPREAEFRAALEEHGHCFAPYYASDPNWGIALHGDHYIERLMQERYGETMGFLRFEKRGWDGHQDVWAFQKKREGEKPKEKESNEK